MVNWMEDNIWGDWWVIYKKINKFTKESILQYKRDVNNTQIIPSETKKKIKRIALKGGLYSQIVVIWSSILKETGKDNCSEENKINKQSSDTITVEDGYKDHSCVEYKDNERSGDSPTD